ncbi:TPA: tetratricopeptide repeat protein [Candidatus Poribacteria bacterium]|nr:tetratricopeptide repeat protein [Candidatus Poribacteria bacterium]
MFKRIHRQSEKMFLLKRAVDVNPSNSQNWYRLAQAYFENQDLGGGLDALNRAIQLQPENLSYHQLIGKVYLQVQALDYAINAFQTVIGLEPS